jgi:hypothetical protein
MRHHHPRSHAQPSHRSREHCRRDLLRQTLLASKKLLGHKNSKSAQEARNLTLQTLPESGFKKQKQNAGFSALFWSKNMAEIL